MVVMRFGEAIAVFGVQWAGCEDKGSNNHGVICGGAKRDYQNSNGSV